MNESEKKQIECRKCGPTKFNHYEMVADPQDRKDNLASAGVCKKDGCDCQKFQPLVCEECGENLKSSQYARKIPEGAPAQKSHEVLVCRNYPNCTKAEKKSINH